MILETTLIIICSTSGLTLGGVIGFFLGDRRRRNLERDRHYDELVYYLQNDTPLTDDLLSVDPL